ncbi:hypothetical protein D3C81_2187550 [compost metagenome]
MLAAMLLHMVKSPHPVDPAADLRSGRQTVHFMEHFVIRQNHIQHSDVTDITGVTGLPAAMRIEGCLFQHQI